MKKVMFFALVLAFLSPLHNFTEALAKTPQVSAIKPVSSCPFCQIAGGQNKNQVIRTGENVMAIRKRRPIMYGQNFLVIPKNHHVNLIETDAEKSGELFAEIIELVQELAAEGKRNGGTGHFTLTFNNGASSAQSVFHMHAHVTSPDTDWGFTK